MGDRYGGRSDANILDCQFYLPANPDRHLALDINHADRPGDVQLGISQFGGVLNSFTRATLERLALQYPKYRLMAGLNGDRQHPSSPGFYQRFTAQWVFYNHHLGPGPPFFPVCLDGVECAQANPNFKIIRNFLLARLIGVRNGRPA